MYRGGGGSVIVKEGESDFQNHNLGEGGHNHWEDYKNPESGSKSAHLKKVG